jgi:hypothetical protein
MIQPATLNEREAAGDRKISTYSGCDVSELLLLLPKWSKLIKREVVVEVYVEMLLKENNSLFLLLLLFLVVVVVVVMMMMMMMMMTVPLFLNIIRCCY